MPLWLAEQLLKTKEPAARFSVAGMARAAATYSHHSHLGGAVTRTFEQNEQTSKWWGKSLHKGCSWRVPQMGPSYSFNSQVAA